MKIQVEFTGVAREILGQRQVELVVDDDCTYSCIVRQIGLRYPQLQGIFIDKNSLSLLSGNVLSRNGEETILPGMMNQSPQDGDRLIFLIFIVGG